MTVNQMVIDAVKTYVPACVYGAYLGTDKTYCYFLLPKTDTVINGDDDAILDNTPIQLHLFTPSNFTTLKDK